MGICHSFCPVLRILLLWLEYPMKEYTDHKKLFVLTVVKTSVVDYKCWCFVKNAAILFMS